MLKSLLKDPNNEPERSFMDDQYKCPECSFILNYNKL